MPGPAFVTVTANFATSPASIVAVDVVLASVTFGLLQVTVALLGVRSPWLPTEPVTVFAYVPHSLAVVVALHVERDARDGERGEACR